MHRYEFFPFKDMGHSNDTAIYGHDDFTSSLQTPNNLSQNGSRPIVSLMASVTTFPTASQTRANAFLFFSSFFRIRLGGLRRPTRGRS